MDPETGANVLAALQVRHSPMPATPWWRRRRARQLAMSRSTAEAWTQTRPGFTPSSEARTRGGDPFCPAV